MNLPRIRPYLVIATAEAVGLAIGGYFGYRYGKKKAHEEIAKVLDEEAERFINHFKNEKPIRIEKDGSPQEMAAKLIKKTPDRPLPPPVPIVDADNYPKTVVTDYAAVKPVVPGYIAGVRDPEEEVHIFDKVQEDLGEVDLGEEIPAEALTGSYDQEEVRQFEDVTAENQRPFIIPTDVFMSGNLGYEQSSPTFYVGDSILADERDEPIDNVDDVVGDINMTRFGDKSGDANVVYIRNHRLGIDFEVTRNEGRYAEIVLGIRPRR